MPLPIALPRAALLTRPIIAPGGIPANGMVFRLRASDVLGVTAGNSIPQANLIESSGSGATIALADTDRSPRYAVVNGLPTIQMLNSSGQAHVRIDVSNIPGLNLDTMTMFVVNKPSSLADAYMCSFIGTNVRLIQTTANSTWSVNNQANSPFAAGYTLSTSTRNIMAIRATTAGAAQNADGIDLNYNGQRLFRHRTASSSTQWGKDAGGNPLAQVPTSLYLGTHQNGAQASNWWGDLHEIIIWNRALSDVEMATVQSILATTWGSIGLTTPTDQLVVDGDSLSVGLSGDGLINTLRTILPATCAIRSYGIGGQTTPFLDSIGARIDAAYNPSYLHNILIAPFGEPTNYLNGGAATAQQAHDATATYNANRKAAHAGWKIISTGCLARGLSGLAGDFETRRLAGNALMQADKAGADYYLAVENDTRFDLPADAADTTNYNVDTVHLVAGDATHGYVYVATSLFKPEVIALLNGDPTSLLVSDTFTRADNAAPGLADTGQAWTNGGSGGNGIQIIGNQAAPVNTSGGNGFIPVGVADHRAEMTMTTLGSNCGLIVRYVDSTHYVQAVIGAGTTLVVTEAGGAGTLDTQSVTWANGDVIRMEAQGTTIRVYQNGVLKSTSTASNNPSATAVGIRPGVGAAARFDNFKAYGIM